jgi:L-glutamine-phosphate cytidylyltransferase
MRAIILAAGEGKRLRPLTENVPKCLVKYKDKEILSYTLDVLNEFNIKDVVIVGGYKVDVLNTFLQNTDTALIENRAFNSTNMVSTLFCAKKFLNEDLIISYSDIAYNKSIVKKLLDNSSEVGVIVDKAWRKLWEQRMENPLYDAETLKVDKNNNILELGKKPKDYKEIEGQYIGLFKVSKQAWPKIISIYEGLDREKLYDGQSFDNMYMTSFIQLLIDTQFEVKAIDIKGDWIEIDEVSDLDIIDIDL